VTPLLCLNVPHDICIDTATLPRDMVSERVKSVQFGKTSCCGSQSGRLRRIFGCVNPDSEISCIPGDAVADI
jgi:hypothetical protein